MKFFVDTADIDEIKELADSGMVDGVTTNPSLIAKSGRKFMDVLKEICDLIPGPVSAEVVALTRDEMLKEADILRKVADNVVIKLPLTFDGLSACKALTDEGTKTNVTLCFSPSQALLAAKAGATYISPFVGRLDDISEDGMGLIRDIVTIYDQYDNLNTEVLVASVRHPGHIVEAALAGAHVATLPPKVIKQLYKHPLTDAGLEAFMKDWEKTGDKIVA